MQSPWSHSPFCGSLSCELFSFHDWKHSCNTNNVITVGRVSMLITQRLICIFQCYFEYRTTINSDKLINFSMKVFNLDTIRQEIKSSTKYLLTQTRLVQVFGRKSMKTRFVSESPVRSRDFAAEPFVWSSWTQNIFCRTFKELSNDLFTNEIR